jgi:glucose-1-phosphate adenylyltransferase
MTTQRILGLVLAGSAGRRLAPLTAGRAKSAVPFGGFYRLVDFALSNLVNAQIRRIFVLSQYKCQSLNRHITTTWQLNALLDNYVIPVPAQQRLGPYWQAGSADAIHQSLNLIDAERPDLVVVAGADHVYRMDARPMIEQHRATGAGVTVSALPVPRRHAASFGVIQTEPGGQAGISGRRIEAWDEKPADTRGLPDRPLASMGVYVFDCDVLVEAIRKDAADDDSRHGLGSDIIPRLVRERAACVYDFTTNQVPGAQDHDLGYWRELGTLDAYFGAHMDLCAPEPAFTLHNGRWPILTHVHARPPARFTGENGRAIDSVICTDVVVRDGLVRDSVLSPGVRTDAGSLVSRSVLLHNTRVGRGATVTNAILDKNVVVLDGASVGVDRERDLARGFTVSSGGVTVVGKGQVVQ